MLISHLPLMVQLLDTAKKAKSNDKVINEMLSEYKNEIGLVAGIITLVNFFSPVLLCRNIMKRGSTIGISTMPFVGGLVLSIIFIQSALLIQDNIILYINLFGMVLGLCYLFVYYLYTKEKVQFYIKLSKMFVFVAVLISYAQREDPNLIKFRFGLISTLLLFAVIASPLLNLGTIIKTRNTDLLPMPLITVGALVAFTWLLYGLAINDSFVQIQNMIAFFLQIFQIALYVYLKVGVPSKKETKVS